MLMGPVDHVPYGWSHTLTMPQGALGIARSIADPQLAIDVAGEIYKMKLDGTVVGKFGRAGKLLKDGAAAVGGAQRICCSTMSSNGRR